jgi:two-component system, response regulator FlrC
MEKLLIDASLARRHAPLVQRAQAILGTLAQTQSLQLMEPATADAQQTLGHVLCLERAMTPSIRRRPASARTSGFDITYADPSSDSALAAVLACAGQAGSPVAADPESLSVLALAERLAASDIPVLIGGPTGTGKEVLSRFIHAHSPRAKGPFVAVNCAAMPEAMLEAMLFGHTKGAFTGAAQAAEGFFRAAHGGTLLLDEIAEMPLALQAKLLRALQEGEVVPIGSTQPIPVDVRVIAAANRDLPTEVHEGRFRADLYYRLNVFPLSLRPLRERAEDIAPLAFAMVLRHTPAHKPIPWISEGALAMLRLHGWPGNVRELENVIRRALLLADNGASATPMIRPEHIHFDSPARLVEAVEPQIDMIAERESNGRRLSAIVQIHEARAILDTLAACGGNRMSAARQLGISERTLRYRLASMREAGIAVAAGGRR